MKKKRERGAEGDRGRGRRMGRKKEAENTKKTEKIRIG
jgi:hypothetical protein